MYGIYDDRSIFYALPNYTPTGSSYIPSTSVSIPASGGAGLATPTGGTTNVTGTPANLYSINPLTGGIQYNTNAGPITQPSIDYSWMITDPPPATGLTGLSPSTDSPSGSGATVGLGASASGSPTNNYYSTSNPNTTNNYSFTTTTTNPQTGQPITITNTSYGGKKIDFRLPENRIPEIHQPPLPNIQGPGMVNLTGPSIMPQPVQGANLGFGGPQNAPTFNTPNGGNIQLPVPGMLPQTANADNGAQSTFNPLALLHPLAQYANPVQTGVRQAPMAGPVIMPPPAAQGAPLQGMATNNARPMSMGMGPQAIAFGSEESPGAGDIEAAMGAIGGIPTQQQAPSAMRPLQPMTPQMAPQRSDWEEDVPTEEAPQKNPYRLKREPQFMPLPPKPNPILPPDMFKTPVSNDVKTDLSAMIEGLKDISNIDTDPVVQSARQRLTQSQAALDELAKKVTPPTRGEINQMLDNIVKANDAGDLAAARQLQDQLDERMRDRPRTNEELKSEAMRNAWNSFGDPRNPGQVTPAQQGLMELSQAYLRYPGPQMWKHMSKDLAQAAPHLYNEYETRLQGFYKEAQQRNDKLDPERLKQEFAVQKERVEDARKSLGLANQTALREKNRQYHNLIDSWKAKYQANQFISQEDRDAFNRYAKNAELALRQENQWARETLGVNNYNLGVMREERAGEQFDFAVGREAADQSFRSQKALADAQTKYWDQMAKKAEFESRVAAREANIYKDTAIADNLVGQTKERHSDYQAPKRPTPRPYSGLVAPPKPYEAIGGYKPDYMKEPIKVPARPSSRLTRRLRDGR
jgi:hypothetical protein